MPAPPANRMAGQPPSHPNSPAPEQHCQPPALNSAGYQFGAEGSRAYERQGRAHLVSAGSDSYLSGMASDSELNTAPSSRHHHRPFAGQARAYHVHPVPRSAHGSSRMSHYSDSAASYSPGARLAGSQQRQHAVSHQGSVSSSASGGSVSSASGPLSAGPAYAGAMGSGDSPLSPGVSGAAVRQLAARQLPQRPFKQSVSIDQQAASSYVGRHQPLVGARPISSHYPFDAPDLQSAGFPAQSYSLAQRLAQAQEPSPVQQRAPFGQQQPLDSSSRSHPYAPELELIDKQVAGLSLYESALAQAQPSARPSSASSMRQLPALDAIAGRPLAAEPHASLPLETHRPRPFPHHHPMHHAYSQSEPLHSGRLGQAPAEWLPPLSHHSARGGQQHTASVDHYSSVGGAQHAQSGYHAAAPFPPQPAGDSYRSALDYASSSPVCGRESPSLAGYAMYEHYARRAEMSGQQLGRAHHSQESAYPSGAGPSQQQPRGPPSSSSGQTQSQRPTVQHQISSSSSNSQSGSLRDVHKASASHELSQHQPSTSQRAALPPHAPSPLHSPQHKSAPTSRHALRKGYTSVTCGNADSLLARSDSGEVSGAQPLPGGQQLGKRTLRAHSPSMATESSSTSAGHQQLAGAGTRSESSTGLPGANGSGSSLTKKSNSATQLSMTGTKKRLGFRKKQVTSFSVHRSEEVVPFEARHLVKQTSSVSEGDSSMSGDSSSRSWSHSNFKQPTADELASMSFIEGLGRGQMISRQGLASPYLGDIQLSLCDRRGNLEVEVIRARNLQAKANKVLPLTYVKLYLVKNRKCLAKAKTLLSNKRTLDPLFQQQLSFHEDYHGCILQSIIWGNFGKMDKKNFMGIAQISIDDLELSETVLSWYKLFLPSSLQTLPSKSLRHTLLSNSTESFTNTNNS